MNLIDYFFYRKVLSFVLQFIVFEKENVFLKVSSTEFQCLLCC